MRFEPDEADLVEGTSTQGSLSNDAVQSKTRKKLSQSYEDEENIRATKRTSRSRMEVTPQTLGPLPRISATNGSGTLVNKNVGNTYNLTTSE
jgi:hypothetical protein